METSGNLVKLDQSARSVACAEECAVAYADRLPGNSDVFQIRNAQRSSRSGFTCQCGASETDSTEVRIPSPARSNDLGRTNRTSTGGTNFTHGATGIVWLTGVSISLKAVSGRSVMGMTETQVTAAARRSRNASLLRFNTRALQVGERYRGGSWLSRSSSTIGGSSRGISGRFWGCGGGFFVLDSPRFVLGYNYPKILLRLHSC